MNIKILLTLLFFLMISSCQETKNTGRFLLDIHIQDQVIQSIVEITDSGGKLYNSDETIPLFKEEGGYRVDSNYALLKFNQDSSNGLWVRDNKKDYQVKFTKSSTKLTDLFTKEETKECPQVIEGKWKFDLGDEKTGLGNFTQIGCRVKGSVLTTTGDLRYLDGYLKGDQLFIQGFDGVFAIIFNLKLSGEKLAGKFYWGNSFNREVSATKDANFELADANTMTQILKHDQVKIKLVDIEGETIDITQGSYAKRPKVLQLFGSWCPNCLDETRFILNWKKENPDLAKKIDFIALSFENFEQKDQAVRALKRTQKRLKMDYPLILVDYNKTVKATDLLPIDKVRAFPTTLYLDKNNKLLKVHTGFAGQATGPYFEHFVKDFTKTVRNITN